MHHLSALEQPLLPANEHRRAMHWKACCAMTVLEIATSRVLRYGKTLTAVNRMRASTLDTSYPGQMSRLFALFGHLALGLSVVAEGIKGQVRKEAGQ